MTRLRSMFVLVLALFALASPTLAGTFAAVALDGAVMVTSDEGSIVLKSPLTPCQAQGGKRVLPCSPDLGVLISGGIGLPQAVVTRHPADSDPIPAGVIPGLLTRPPRHS